MKIGVIGGGAAGMTAAIAAKRKGADVTILEGRDRLGQKILSTGNGKCNLGNMELDGSWYYGTDPSIPEGCLREFNTQKTIAFFQDMGLFIREKNGYLYPYGEQASAVLDVLRQEVEVLGIRVLYGYKVEDIQKDPKGGFWLLDSQNKKEHFDLILLACGGKAAPKTGSDGSGIQLAKKLGHEIVPVIPALTYLKCAGENFKAISGVRVRAEVKLLDEKGNELACEMGELQLTDLGISGIPVFQMSRIAGYALQKGKKTYALIDLMPEYSEAELQVLCKERLKLRKGRNLESFYYGVLHKKLMQLMIGKAGLKGMQDPMNIPVKQLEQVFLMAKQWKLQVVGTGDFDHAQVSAGGVSFKQVTKELESKIVPGLFFAGEMLDVDGKCGGYNLQWAWASGYLAGSHAGERAVKG